MMVMQLAWLPTTGKMICGGERKSAGGISAAVNASVDGAPQVGWMMARQEQDITQGVFFDACLKMK